MRALTDKELTSLARIDKEQISIIHQYYEDLQYALNLNWLWEHGQRWDNAAI